MAHRSPILGYNHNIGYRGLVFHVQTEDSGVNNPHIFTHLFHGGVILSTRKLDYNADASDDVVKSLMQAQHKAVLKDLKKGTFDDKIDAYLGNEANLLPRGIDTGEDPNAVTAKLADEAERAQAAAAAQAASQADAGELPRRPSPSDISAAFKAAAQLAPSIAGSDSSPRVRAPTPSPIRPAPPPVTSSSSPSSPEVAHIHSPAPQAIPVAQSTTSRITKRMRTEPGADRGSPIKPSPPPVIRSKPGQAVRNTGKVLISRPPIVVDNRTVGRGRQTQPAPPPVTSRRKPTRTVREDSPDGIFDQKLISEKSLDEVILAYLSEDSSEE